MSMQTGVLHRGLFPYLLLSMAALCHVQDAFRHSRGDESGQQQRMRNYLQFAQQLQDVAPIWRAGPGSTLRQVRHILCCVPNTVAMAEQSMLQFCTFCCTCWSARQSWIGHDAGRLVRAFCPGCPMATQGRASCGAPSASECYPHWL